MKKIIQIIYTILSIGVFLWMATASYEIEDAVQSALTPRYEGTDCEILSAVSYSPSVTVTVVDKVTKAPIQGTTVSIWITFYEGKLGEYEICKKVRSWSDQKDYTTDENGMVQATFNSVVFYNKIDRLILTIQGQSEFHESKHKEFTRSRNITSDINFTLELIPQNQLNS